MIGLYCKARSACLSRVSRNWRTRMRSTASRSSRLIVVCTVFALIMALTTTAAAAPGDSDAADASAAKVSPRLLELLQPAAPTSAAPGLNLATDGPGTMSRKGSRYVTQLRVADTSDATIAALAAAGADVIHVAAEYGFVTIAVQSSDILR